MASRFIAECDRIDREEAAYETAARAKGWTRGGDNGGIIYHPNHYGSWKAAVSWSPEQGPVYDSWQECCEAEGIEP